MSLRIALAAATVAVSLSASVLPAAPAPSTVTSRITPAPTAATTAPYHEASRLRLTHSNDVSCSGDLTRLQPAGDFNSDGRPDLIAFHLGALYALTPANNGSFSIFGYANAAPAEATGIGAGDFNGDGRSDVVVAGVNTVNVLINNGSGFNAALVAPLGSIGPRALVTDLAVADFNRDGKLDIAAVDTDPMNYGRYYNLPGGVVRHRSSVAMLWGNGDGTLSIDAAKPRLLAPELPLRTLTEDFNGDGRPELLIASGEYLQLHFNPTAGFATSTTYPPLGIESHVNIYALLGAHFNADSGRDLAIAYYQSGTTPAGSYFRIRPYRYTPHSQVPFVFDGKPLEVSFPYVPIAMATADENSDGRSDLLVAIEGDSNASVAVLRGHGDFTFEAPLIYAGGFSAGAIYAADFTADGRVDVAVIDCSSGELVVLKHD
jgi:hypothetical protein